MKNYDISKFAEKFIDDSHNLLNELESKLLELEHDTSNHELIEAIFRSMHTLKGVGGMFGFNAISEYTHHLETIYDRIREGKLGINREIFQITFTSVDHLRNLLADQNVSDTQLAARHNNLIEDLEKISGKSETKDAISGINHSTENPIIKKAANWYIQFSCTDDLIKRAVNIMFLFQDLAQIGTYSIFKHNQHIQDGINNFDEMWGILLTTEAPYIEIEEVFMFVADYVKIVKITEGNESAPLAKTSQTSSIIELANSIGNNAGEEPTESKVKREHINSERELLRPSQRIPRISVGADKLDKLMFLVSELFTARSELITATHYTDMTRIKIAVEKIDKLSAQFRKNALSIRLVPLRELTLKFKRLIRDLSIQLGKNIEFEIQGDETELDKNLVDSLADPFMHLIRNCIDHGIESPEGRIDAGKEPTGVIQFMAYQSGNYIYIQISDDGKGIDKDYIRKKAIEKGFITANAQLTDKELLDLIFLPGFSTAESLTQLSGRGVGMDVVKRTITELRGGIDIETEKGIGTTFTVKLQQTISIMDTLMIRAGNSYFTILLEDVEICELEAHQTLFKRQNNHLQLADDLIPFISLREAFSIEGEAPETERVIVIKRMETRFAIVADSIIGQYQAVLKPLSNILKHKDYISGASIMGDGNIAFMLDSQKLCETMN